jgi:hypothetical protein
MMNKTEQQIFDEAYEAAMSGACNSTAVARSMVSAMSDLMIMDTSMGTTWVNRHPAVTMYLSVLCGLNGLDFDIKALDKAMSSPPENAVQLMTRSSENASDV